MSKWDSFRGTLDRLHADFEFPSATFTNYTEGALVKGQTSGGYDDTLGSLDVEFVPPQADSSVDTEGTHLGFDTSIRVPTNDLDELSGSLVEYGDDNERPTQVTVENETYEIQAIIPEHGSGMTLLRLTEL